MTVSIKGLDSALDYQNSLQELLAPVISLYRNDSSSISLDNSLTSYPEKTVLMENFSRPLLGLSFIDDPKTAEICFQMIKNGVNPKSACYWGDLSDEAQTAVEQFPILFFCVKNKRMFDNTFSPEEKTHFSLWFNQINQVQVCSNNWRFFPILVNMFLKLLGLDYSDAIISANWAEIDKMYLGNGWYSDGFTKQRDYYNAFAFHFYSLLFAFYTEDVERKRIILERASLFSKTFIYFFSEDGSAVPFGRSLTYKFAQVAFWSVYSNFIEDEKQLSIIKGIVNRNLRWWFTKDIFNNDKFLVNGYTYANPYMTEQYNGPGSPYWGLKAFFCLLNPESLFFSVKETSLPALEDNIEIPEAFLSLRRNNGHSFAFINGQSNVDFCGNISKYEKFVYSSLFGFNISRSDANLSTIAPDSTLVAHINGYAFLRRNAHPVKNTDKVQISDWNPVQGIMIRSFIFIGAPWICLL